MRLTEFRTGVLVYGEVQDLYNSLLMCPGVYF